MAAPASMMRPQTLTWEEYMSEFQTEPATTARYEIIQGVRIVMNAPLLMHQRAAGKIYGIFDAFAEESGLAVALIAPVDVVIRRVPRLQTRQPDVLLISRVRFEADGGFHKVGPLEAAPELVVEVLSDSDTPRELTAKLTDYHAIGVRECWLVDIVARSVRVLQSDVKGFAEIVTYQETDTVNSLVFPSLNVPVARILVI
jgi:Uma2 family endonuclease